MLKADMDDLKAQVDRVQSVSGHAAAVISGLAERLTQAVDDADSVEIRALILKLKGATEPLAAVVAANADPESLIESVPFPGATTPTAETL